MAVEIHPATMFLALVASTISGMLVLLWCYALNRGEKSLLWTAVGFLLSAAATFLMAARGLIPDWASVGVGGALLISGASFLTMAARAFNGDPRALWIPLPGVGIWTIAALIPEVFDNRDLRLSILSVICGIYYLLAAQQYHGRDGLLTRMPLMVVLSVHAIFVFLRVPLILSDGHTGVSMTDAGWFGLSMLEAVVFIQVSSFLMVSLTKERVEEKLRNAAHTDQLTGLGNRRAFFERAEAAIAQARRSGSTLAIAVFDLDRFKDINDRHGHPVGDIVIRAFAQAATQRLRASDFVARIGGEEFAALLPNTDGSRAALVALQVNQAFEAAVADVARPDLAGTASAGVAHLTAAVATLDGLMLAADGALYEAKRMGRGQVRSNVPPGTTGVRAA
jgi:diguanylate cyclase (GGDEF)-like protein